MRILHLLASPVWSGPAELVALLADAQRALGHEVSVAIDRKRGGLGSEEPAAPRFRALDLLDDGDLEVCTKSSPGRVLSDVAELKKRQLDVLHAHFSHDHLIARFGRPKGVTLIRSVHAPRSIRWSLPRADGYTVPYEALREKLEGKKVRVLPALVPASFAPPKDRAQLRGALRVEGDPLIGMVSTFQESRRHDVALDAFEQLLRQRPGARLLLVGDGVLGPQLRERAAAFGDRVVFAGYQSGDAFLHHVQALDELWLLGLGNDWGARAAAQAKACGVRVVGVDEGAVAQWADVVLPSAEPEALVRASLSPARRDVRMRPARDVAADVLDFYVECRPREGE